MSTADVLLGLLILGVVLVASAITAKCVVDRYCDRDLSGVERWVALGLVFAAAYFAVHLIPGLFGILHREVVVLTAALLAGLAILLGRHDGAGTRPARDAQDPASAPPSLGNLLVAPPGEARASWVIGVIAVAAVSVYLVGSAIDHATVALLHVDVASFHLPNIARWIQDASVWQVDDFIPFRAPGNYPQTGDIFLLGVILPFSNEFLVRFVGLPFLALAGLSIFAAGREMGASRGPSALVAAALVSMPAFGYIALRGLADPVMVGTFAAGAFFLLRAWRTGSGFELVLAGIGLGLAFGTRWYAVYAVGALVVVWFAASLIAGRRDGLLGRTAVLGVPAALFGGFWLLRNWIESGNPVFPVKVAFGSLTIFDAPPDRYREIEGYSLLHYADSPGVWRTIFWPTFLDIMSFVAVIFWALMPVAAVVAWRRFTTDPQRAGKMAAMVVVAGLIGIAYVITPYTAVGPEGAPVNAWVNSRYVIPALIVLAPAVAWLLARSGRLALFGQGLLLLALLDALRRSTQFFEGTVGTAAVLAAVAVIGLVVGLAVLWRSLRDRGGFGPAALAAAVLGALALGVIAFENRFAELRHTNLGEPIAIVDAAPAGTRVGLLGDGWGNYPLFGPELENEVEFIGPRVDEMLATYDTKEALAAALDAGRYDYVYTQDIDALEPERPDRQQEWLDQLGWTRVATGQNLSFGGDIETALYTPPSSG